MSFSRHFPLFFIVPGLILFILSTWPLPGERSIWQTSSPDSAAGTYQFTLSWPTAIRVSEPRVARLTVQPPLAIPENSVLIARLEFSGLSIDPSGEITEPVHSGGMNEFQWSLEPITPGIHSGTLWLYTANSLAAAASQRQAVISRPLEVRAIHLGPLPVIWLRWLGISLLAVGAVLLLRRSGPNARLSS